MLIKAESILEKINSAVGLLYKLKKCAYLSDYKCLLHNKPKQPVCCRDTKPESESCLYARKKLILSGFYQNINNSKKEKSSAWRLIIELVNTISKLWTITRRIKAGAKEVFWRLTKESKIIKNGSSIRI